MKNNDHKVVQDLFPSYIDGLTSEETNNLVEEHIKTCEECKNVLEQMKEKITEENHSQLDKEQIDYAKKYKRSLIIVITVVTVSLILFAWAVIDYYRRVFIFQKLDDLGKKYKDYNNYTIKVVGSDNGTELESFPGNSQNFYDIYVKDGKELIVSMTMNYDSYNKDMFPIVSMQKSYYDSMNNDSYKIDYNENGEIENVEHSENNQFNIHKIVTFSDYFSEYTPLYMALESDVSLKKFDGIDCYEVELENGSIIYFEKDTGLIRKIDNKYYSYEFDNVSDDIVELPEIPDNVKN